MSDIYVKWTRLSDSANRLRSYSSKINQYKNTVSGIKNSLGMSEKLAEAIKGKLAREVSVLGDIEINLKKYSSALADVAEIYKNTEKNNAKQ